jgi:uncharacterized protein (DUF427 family)
VTARRRIPARGRASRSITTFPWVGSTHHDAAWSYPDPYPTSFDRVGKDYSGYIAFDKQQVTIAE